MVQHNDKHLEVKKLIIEARDAAIRLDNDVNGNPRYYIPISNFLMPESSRDPETMLRDRFRPFNASMYRGKKYGAGWVFQSYNLMRHISIAFAEAYNIPREEL